MYKFIIIIFCSITHLLKRNYNLCNSYYVVVKNFKQIRNKDIKQIYGTFKNNSYWEPFSFKGIMYCVSWW